MTWSRHNRYLYDTTDKGSALETELRAKDGVKRWGEGEVGLRAKCQQPQDEKNLAGGCSQYSAAQ